MSFHAFRPWLPFGEEGNICPAPHFTFLPPTSPTLHYQENKTLKPFLKNRKRSNHPPLEARGHGTHSGCFRVETNSELDSLRPVAPSFPLFDLFVSKHTLDLPKPKQKPRSPPHTHSPNKPQAFDLGSPMLQASVLMLELRV